MSDTKHMEASPSPASASASASSSAAAAAVEPAAVTEEQEADEEEDTVKRVDTLALSQNSKHQYTPLDLLHGLEAAIATGRSRLARVLVLELVATFLESGTGKRNTGEKPLSHYLHAMFYITAIDRCSPNSSAFADIESILARVKTETDHTVIARLYARLAHKLARGPRSSLIKSMHEFLIHRSARLIAPPGYIFNEDVISITDNMTPWEKLTYGIAAADRSPMKNSAEALNTAFTGAVRKLSEKPSAKSHHAFVVNTAATAKMFSHSKAVWKNLVSMDTAWETAPMEAEVARKMPAEAVSMSDGKHAETTTDPAMPIISHGLMIAFELTLVAYHCIMNAGSIGGCRCCCVTTATHVSDTKSNAKKPAPKVCMPERKQKMEMLWTNLETVTAFKTDSPAYTNLKSLRRAFFAINSLKAQVSRSFSTRLEMAQTRLLLLARGMCNAPFVESFLTEYPSESVVSYPDVMNEEIASIVAKPFDASAARPFELPEWMFNRFTMRGQGKHSVGSLFANARANLNGVLKWDVAKVTHSHGCGFVFNDKTKTLFDRDARLIADKMVNNMVVEDIFLDEAVAAQSAAARGCDWIQVVNQRLFEEKKNAKGRENSDKNKNVQTDKKKDEKKRIAIAMSTILNGVEMKETQVIKPNSGAETYGTAKKLWSSSFASVCAAWGWYPSELANPPTTAKKSPSPSTKKKSEASTSESEPEDDAPAAGDADADANAESDAKVTVGSKRKWGGSRKLPESTAAPPPSKKRRVEADATDDDSDDTSTAEGKMADDDDSDADKDVDDARARKLEDNQKICALLLPLMRKGKLKADLEHNAIVQHCIKKSLRSL